MSALLSLPHTQRHANLLLGVLKTGVSLALATAVADARLDRHPSRVNVVRHVQSSVARAVGSLGIASLRYIASHFGRVSNRSGSAASEFGGGGAAAGLGEADTDVAAELVGELEARNLVGGGAGLGDAAFDLPHPGLALANALGVAAAVGGEADGAGAGADGDVVEWVLRGD